MNVNVLLSGRLKIDGYGEGRFQNCDGSYRLAVPDGSTVKEIIRSLRIPRESVALTMVNARQSDTLAHVKAEDRIVLIPSASVRELAWSRSW
jgi:sulfur carrier protein ThiS